MMQTTMKKINHLSRLSKILVAVALCTGATVGMAQQKFVRAQATDSNKEMAVNKAKVAAWKNYLGTLQGAKLDNIVANEKTFLDDINNIVVDVSVVDEKCTSGFLSSTCTVSIKAAINETVIESRLRQTAQALGGGKAGAQDDIAFLVIARVADSQTSFDSKVTKRAESTVGTSGSSASADASAINKTGAAEASADAVSVTQTSKTVVGGSQENKRDRIKYVAWPNIDDLQNRVGEALTNNRISTVPWEDLVSNCGVTDNDPFSKMYAESETGQLPTNIRNDMFKKLKECQLTKIILASIEVDGYRNDPNTGLWLASGNMNITVYDLTGRFSRSIGSANRTFSGRAEKLNDAGRAALANAAKMASDVVINQLNLK
ncbi:MAG: hypothetical protein EXR78_09340 [Deltaproteobacteria bacterium]|nr:hypothetical protein [Deltaproteobacteria bacterium]